MKLIILQNDIKVLLVIGLLVLAASSCKKEVVSVSREESVETIVDSNVVYLDRDLYTEEYIKKNVGKGMSAVQVEEIVGEPYKIDGFMGTERASYLLSPPNTRGLHLVEFTIVYKDGEVVDVDMHWMGM